MGISVEIAQPFGERLSHQEKMLVDLQALLALVAEIAEIPGG